MELLEQAVCVSVEALLDELRHGLVVRVFGFVVSWMCEEIFPRRVVLVVGRCCRAVALRVRW